MLRKVAFISYLGLSIIVCAMNNDKVSEIEESEIEIRVEVRGQWDDENFIILNDDDLGWFNWCTIL